jgi:hypothetical protein
MSTKETEDLAEAIVNARNQDNNAAKDKVILLQAHIAACKKAWHELNGYIVENCVSTIEETYFEEKGIKLSTYRGNYDLWLLSDGRIMETHIERSIDPFSGWRRTKKIIDDLEGLFADKNYDACKCIENLQKELIEGTAIIVKSTENKREDIANINRKYPLSQ